MYADKLPTVGKEIAGVWTRGDICWVRCRQCDAGIAHMEGQYWKSMASAHAQSSGHRLFRVFSFRGAFYDYEFAPNAGLDPSLHDFRETASGVLVEFYSFTANPK